MTSEFSRTIRKLRLRHFELLTLLATELTLRGAARRMALTQPAVSKMLREIEECYGGELFERSHTGIVANACGTKLTQHAIALMHELRAAGEEIEVIAGGASAMLRVGTLSVIPRVPIAIARLRQLDSGIVVRVLEGRLVDLVGSLLESQLDCIVGALPPEFLQSPQADQLTIETVADDRLCVMACASHRLARSRRLHWRNLSGEDWVLPPRDSLLRRCVVDGHLLAGLVPPQPVVELLSPISMAGLLSLDSGLIGVMRLEQAQAEYATERLRILPVSPFVALPPISLITRRSRAHPSQALLAFRNVVIDKNTTIDGQTRTRKSRT